MTETPILDPMAGFLSQTATLVKGLILPANAVADQIINAGNSQKLVHEYRDDAETTDEKVLAYRAAMEQLNEKVLEWQKDVEAHIVAQGYVSTEPINVEEKTAEFVALRTQVKAALGMLKTLPGGDAVIADLPELKNLPGTRGGGTNGSVTARPRVSEVAVKAAGEEGFTALSSKGPKDKAGNDTHVSNFSTLARYFAKSGNPVDVPELHKAAFAAAGTEDLSSLNGTPFVFAVGTTIVRITPSVKG